ncbi:MAG: hypothetical protein CMP20_15375 [Rickettsiales bacterium]|nr:hypothetical protein [Rickettsiales bacterium]
MSALPAAKRHQRLDGSASPIVGRSFSVLNIEDFEAHVEEPPEEEAAASSTHPQSLLDIVDCAINNAATLMQHCGFNSLYERGETSRSEEQNAQLAKSVLQSCQDDMTVSQSEYVSIRNVFTRVGLDFKYHLEHVLDGEPPMCDARYHQDFLRTPLEIWERPCSNVKCEGKEIIDAPLREFLLPKENQELLQSIEEGRAVFPDRKPICLLCDRSVTSMFARQHDANNPLFKYTDEATHKVGNVELLSSNGYPLTINSHQVVHGEPGGYLSNRLIPSNQGGKAPGIVGEALQYVRSDYTAIDRTEIDGCVWVDQSRLLFPTASTAN